MPAALTPPWKVHTPIREPPVMRENASATATAYRSSRIISIGTPSRPRALFTRQTGKVETQSTPSCLRMRTMPVATSIVMDVVSFGWSRDVSVCGRIEPCHDRACDVPHNHRGTAGARPPPRDGTAIRMTRHEANALPELLATDWPSSPSRRRNPDRFEPRMRAAGTGLQAVKISADIGAGQVQHLAPKLPVLLDLRLGFRGPAREFPVGVAGRGDPA